jgi:hypothetical protein
VIALSGFIGPDSNQNGPEWKLILIDANGTVNDRLQVVGAPISVQELIPSSTWSLAPNPSTSVTSLRIPLGAISSATFGQGAMATVIDGRGSVVMEKSLILESDALTGTLRVDGIPSGTYHVLVTGSNRTHIGVVPLRVVK